MSSALRHATGRLAVLFEDRQRPLSLITLAIDGQHASALIRAELVRRLEEHLTSALRKDDLFASQADGRLLLLAPGADLREAAELAERLRDGVARAAIGIAGQAGPITISLGVAEREDHMSGPAALLDLAELALDLGAQEGPNQVHPAA